MASAAPPRALPPNVVFVAVAIGVVAGVALAVMAHPFWGLGLIGATLDVAGAARLTLSERSAGLLVVRARVTDALTLVTLGTLILVLAFLLH